MSELLKSQGMHYSQIKDNEACRPPDQNFGAAGHLLSGVFSGTLPIVLRLHEHKLRIC